MTFEIIQSIIVTGKKLIFDFFCFSLQSNQIGGGPPPPPPPPPPSVGPGYIPGARLNTEVSKIQQQNECSIRPFDVT